MIRAALGLLLMALTSTQAFAHPRFHLTTKILISMKQPYVDVFQECLYREIRQIPEVTVVGKHDAAEEVVSIVVIQNKNTYGYDFGYSAGVDFFYTPNVGVLDPLWKNKASETAGNMLLSGAVFPDGQYILTDSSLISLCGRIVALYDTHPVEQMRQTYRRMRESAPSTGLGR